VGDFYEYGRKALREILEISSILLVAGPRCEYGKKALREILKTN